MTERQTWWWLRRVNSLKTGGFSISDLSEEFVRWAGVSMIPGSVGKKDDNESRTWGGKIEPIITNASPYFTYAARSYI